MDQPVGRIDVISDVICPWCYIGKRHLERALDLLKQRLRFTVAWHPFQLNPDMPREGVERASYRTAKFGSADGFRFELAFVWPDGVEARAIVAGAVVKNRLQLIVYLGTRLHYFDKYRPAIDRLFESVRVQ